MLAGKMTSWKDGCKDRQLYILPSYSVHLQELHIL